MDRIKYPRTFNLPWSQSNSSDDCWWSDCRPFVGQQVVVTAKMDGECTTIYPDGWVHARSLDTTHHPSRSWVKAYAAQWAHQIPEGWRVSGENLYAWHSIFYTGLPSYFLAFGMYDEQNICVAWEDVELFCEMAGLHTVPVLYKGVWDETLIRETCHNPRTYPTFTTSVENPQFPNDFQPCEAEGYVVRLAGPFAYDEFKNSCAKYVRAHHVTTPTNWLQRPVFPNFLVEK